MENFNSWDVVGSLGRLLTSPLSCTCVVKQICLLVSTLEKSSWVELCVLSSCKLNRWLVELSNIPYQIGLQHPHLHPPNSFSALCSGQYRKQDLKKIYLYLIFVFVLDALNKNWWFCFCLLLSEWVLLGQWFSACGPFHLWVLNNPSSRVAHQICYLSGIYITIPNSKITVMK